MIENYDDPEMWNLVALAGSSVLTSMLNEPTVPLLAAAALPALADEVWRVTSKKKKMTASEMRKLVKPRTRRYRNPTPGARRGGAHGYEWKYVPYKKSSRLRRRR